MWPDVVVVDEEPVLGNVDQDFAHEMVDARHMVQGRVVEDVVKIHAGKGVSASIVDPFLSAAGHHAKFICAAVTDFVVDVHARSLCLTYNLPRSRVGAEPSHSLAASPTS